MSKVLKKLGILTERGWLIALAVAAGLVLGMAGPTSAQFLNFGGYQQRPQPQRGGGWFGNINAVAAGLVTTCLRRTSSSTRRLVRMDGKRPRGCAKIFQRRRRPRSATLYPS